MVCEITIKAKDENDAKEFIHRIINEESDFEHVLDIEFLRKLERDNSFLFKVTLDKVDIADMEEIVDDPDLRGDEESEGFVNVKWLN